MSTLPFGKEWLDNFLHAPRKISNFILLSVILGFSPVLDSIILRSYGYGVQPNWLENLRIMDFPEILLEIAVVLWARHRGMNFRQYWRLIPFYLKAALLIFFSTFWIGAVWSSPIPAISILRSSYWLIHLGFGVSVFHLIKSEKLDVTHYINWQVAGLALLAVITAAHLIHITQLPASYANQVKWSGAIPGCMSVRHFGILTGSVAALYAGHYCWKAPQDANRWVALLICTFLIGLTVWSGTRNAAVGFFGGFLMIAIATRSLPGRSKMAIVLGASFLAVVLSTPLLPHDSAFGFYRWTDVQLTADDLSSGRLTIWYFAWNLFLDHWAFGLGEGAMNAIEITGTGTHHLQPHNSIFQFLYSWGVFAASAMAVIISGTFIYLHQKIAKNIAMVGPLLMADALLIMSLFDGILFFSRMIMPLVFCTALCLAMQQHCERATR